jgi:hypothetical protein
VLGRLEQEARPVGAARVCLPGRLQWLARHPAQLLQRHLRKAKTPEVSGCSVHFEHSRSTLSVPIVADHHGRNAHLTDARTGQREGGWIG